jgi:hypothetical protein
VRVLIIGAGTGGLALAHALTRGGIEVSVFERDLAPNADTGGFRVGISPGGSRALKACVPPEAYALFVATCARAPRYFNMLTEQLSEVLCLEMEGAPADAMDGEKNVIRKTLRRVLLTGLENHVAFGKGLVSYTHNPDGTVTARFADGSHATGDVLVGADGSGSAVRKQRLPQARLEDTGMVSLGGKFPMTAQSRALLSDKMFYGMSMIMAPKGFGAIIHSLEFAQNRTDASFTARWPNFVDALDDDSIGWGIWGARQNFPRDPAALNGEELLHLGLELTRARGHDRGFGGELSRHQNLRPAAGLGELERHIAGRRHPHHDSRTGRRRQYGASRCRPTQPVADRGRSGAEVPDPGDPRLRSRDASLQL